MIDIKPRNIACNPIARAYAKERLKKLMLDCQIKLYLAEDGEDVKALIVPLADGIFSMARAYELISQTQSVEYRKLRSAMNVLTQCSEARFKWRKDYAVTVDNALQICVEKWTTIPVQTFHLAMKEVMG